MIVLDTHVWLCGGVNIFFFFAAEECVRMIPSGWQSGLPGVVQKRLSQGNGCASLMRQAYSARMLFLAFLASGLVL
jgi:hypothetical protein